MTDLSHSKKPVIRFVIINKIWEDETLNGFMVYILFNWKNATNPIWIFPQNLQDWKINVASVWFMPQ